MQFLKRPTPHVIAFIVFLAYYLVVVQDLRHFSARDPGSVFFDPDHAFEPAYSEGRRVQAETFIHSAEKIDASDYVKESDNPGLCLGIATVQREGARYFRSAVGSVLAGLTDEERKDVYLVSFIANADPAQHMAYNESWLAHLSDRVLTYKDAPENVSARAQELERTDLAHQEKPLFDYIYLMRTCYDTGAPYIVMIEDDTIAADGWYYRTTHALKDLERKKDFDNTVYLRLFYNERRLGWNSEQWLRFLIWSIAIETILVGIIFAVLRCCPPSAKALTRATVATICFVCAPMCIALYFAAGRLTVQPLWRGLNRMDNYGCCSQALIFPRGRVPELIEYYEGVEYGLIDQLTEIYANEHGLSRWALTPSVFQHVGSKSSKSTFSSSWGRNSAENIWNFSFEEFDAEELKDLH